MENMLALILLIWNPSRGPALFHSIQGEPAVSGPKWGGELFNAASSSMKPPCASGCIVTKAVPTGSRIIVLALPDSSAQVRAITDSKGNTYTRDLNCTTYSSGALNSSLWSAQVAKALDATDTVTVAWSGWTEFQPGAINIAYLENTNPIQPDAVSRCYDEFSQTVSIPLTTVSANTVTVGLVWLNDASWAISDGVKYRENNGNVFYDFFYLSASRVRRANPGGTTTSAHWVGASVAYK